MRGLLTTLEPKTMNILIDKLSEKKYVLRSMRKHGMNQGEGSMYFHDIFAQYQDNILAMRKQPKDNKEVEALCNSAAAWAVKDVYKITTRRTKHEQDFADDTYEFVSYFDDNGERSSDITDTDTSWREYGEEDKLDIVLDLARRVMRSEDVEILSKLVNTTEEVFSDAREEDAFRKRLERAIPKMRTLAEKIADSVDLTITEYFLSGDASTNSCRGGNVNFLSTNQMYAEYGVDNEGRYID